MKIGDTVKVLVSNGNAATPDKFVKGKVINLTHIGPQTTNLVGKTLYKVGFGEFSSYKEKEFERHEIKSYIEQSDADFHANFERDIPIGLALANEALKELLPGEVVVYKDVDNELSGYHGAVTISPTQYDQPKIGGFIERTGYEVTVWTVVPSSRWYPEEYVDSPVGTYLTIQLAVRSMIETIFKLKSQDYWQAKADAAQAEAWDSEVNS